MKLDRPLKQQEVDAEKDMLPRVDIVPPAFILAAARGFAFGVWKHGHPPHTNGYGTWRIAGTKQAEPLTHYASLLRHLLKWRAGEVIDSDSGDFQLEHLEAACSQLAVLVDLVKNPPKEDKL